MRISDCSSYVCSSDLAVIRLADAAVAKIYPALRAITFNILADHGITPPTADATDRVLASLRQHVPDGEGATLPEIVTAGWLLLRERGGLSLDPDIAEYKILNELMLKIGRASWRERGWGNV